MVRVDELILRAPTSLSAPSERRSNAAEADWPAGSPSPRPPAQPEHFPPALPGRDGDPPAAEAV